MFIQKRTIAMPIGKLTNSRIVTNDTLKKHNFKNQSKHSNTKPLITKHQMTTVSASDYLVFDRTKKK
jgi:hypothetical protein